MVHRIIAFAPGVDPSEQRSHALNALSAKEPGNAGACDFVGARAIKDNVAVPRDLGVTGFNFIWPIVLPPKEIVIRPSQQKNVGRYCPSTATTPKTPFGNSFRRRTGSSKRHNYPGTGYRD